MPPPAANLAPARANSASARPSRPDMRALPARTGQSRAGARGRCGFSFEQLIELGLPLAPLERALYRDREGERRVIVRRRRRRQEHLTFFARQYRKIRRREVV